MAAGEEQPKPVGVIRFHRLASFLFALQALSGVSHGLGATQAVDRLTPCGDREPAGRVGRDALGGPMLDGREEGVLEGVFGEVEVAEDADQRGQDAAVGVVEDTLDCCFTGEATGGLTGGPGRPSYCCQSGRSSIAPSWALGILAAQLIASSRSLHSKMKTPPICSRVSANGPSVDSVFPSRTRTVVADAAEPRPSLKVMTPAVVAPTRKASQAWATFWNSG